MENWETQALIKFYDEEHRYMEDEEEPEQAEE